MFNKPLVSIIFPIQKWNLFSEKALAVLTAQSYEQIEVVAIWHGEMEKTPANFFSAGPSTLNEAINEGLKKCSGDFITFLMPNDFYALDRIEKCIARLLIENGEFLFSQVLAIDENGDFLPRNHGFWRWKQELELQTDLAPTVGFKLLKEMAPASLGNVIISKRVAERIGFLTNLPHADYEYILRALLVAEPIFLKEELYFYRMLKDRAETFKVEPKEASRIFKEYLLKIAEPPENKLAPCQHYWPMTFSYFRMQNNMDAGLGQDLHALEAKAAPPLQPSMHFPKGNLGKVSLIIHDFSLSGAPRVAADLALALKEDGYEPNVISFSDGPLRPCFDQAGIAVDFIYPRTRFWFAKKKFAKIVFMFSMLVEMFRKTSRTTIAVASLTWSALFIAAFFMPFRKFVWYLHDSYPPEGIVVDGLPFKIFRKCLQRRNLRFWFGSHATREIWENAEVKGEVVYWSGIPQNHEVNQRNAIKTILSVGAGYPRKGAHFLLDAFIHCVREKLIPDDVKLVIVGFSDTLQDLKDFVSDIIFKVHESGLKERIRLVKSIDEVRLEEFYENCDLYVQPSFLECLPLAMLKAMSKGIPVVTAHVDGCNEAIVDGVNGYTCPPRNSAILAKKMAHAIHHSSEAFELGRKGQETFNRKFSLEETKEHFFAALKNENQGPAHSSRITYDLNKKAKPLTELV